MAVSASERRATIVIGVSMRTILQRKWRDVREPGESPPQVRARARRRSERVTVLSSEANVQRLQAAKTLTDRSVLTITGVERGIDQGSMINFVQVDGRVRFEVNVAVAEKSGLRLSSRLLTVATRVKAG